MYIDWGFTVLLKSPSVRSAASALARPKAAALMEKHPNLLLTTADTGAAVLLVFNISTRIYLCLAADVSGPERNRASDAKLEVEN